MKARQLLDLEERALREGRALPLFATGTLAAARTGIRTYLANLGPTDRNFVKRYFGRELRAHL